MIESIKDEAAPTPFNPMEFEDDHRAVSTKRTAAAMAVNKSNNNNDSDVRKHYHSCPRRRYRAHVDEEEEDTLVNRHGQRTAVTLVLLVENNTLQEVDLISIKNAIPEAFLVEERDEEVIVHGGNNGEHNSYLALYVFSRQHWQLVSELPSGFLLE